MTRYARSHSFFVLPRPHEFLNPVSPCAIFYLFAAFTPRLPAPNSLPSLQEEVVEAPDKAKAGLSLVENTAAHSKKPF